MKKETKTSEERARQVRIIVAAIIGAVGVILIGVGLPGAIEAFIGFILIWLAFRLIGIELPFLRH